MEINSKEVFLANEVLRKLILFNESLVKEWGSDEEKHKALNDHFSQFKQIMVTDAEKKEAESILYLLPNGDLKHEFIAKAFLLSIPLRKYLAQHPVELRDLQTSEKGDSMYFTRFVGYHLGFRYVGDLQMNATDRHMYNTSVTFLSSLTVDMEFPKEALISLPAVFARAPIPFLDLINYHKNKKIEELEAKLLESQEVIKVANAEQERLRESNSQLNGKLRDLQNTTLDAAKTSVVLPKSAEVSSRFSVSIGFKSKPVGNPGAKVFELTADKPAGVKVVETKWNAGEGDFGTYTIWLQPTIVGAYSVENVKMDGQILPNSSFQLTVDRDYKLLASVKEPKTIDTYGSQPLGDPWGMAVDKNDEVYVTDCSRQRIFRFNADLAGVDEYTCPKVEGKEPYPRGIVITPNFQLAVVGANIGKIQTFSLSNGGSFDSSFGKGIGKQDGEFSTPRGTCLGPNKEYAIVDTNCHRVQIFSERGEFIRKFGESGRGEGQLWFPAAVAYHPELKMFIVTDCDNSRLLAYEYETGEYKRQVGESGKDAGQFERPSGITVDSLGNVLVTDFVSHYVQVFDKNLNFVARFGGPSVLNAPRGIVVDSRGRVWVADMMNHRVVVF